MSAGKRNTTRSSNKLNEKINNDRIDYVINMSHDIRTTMNAILGYTDIALHNEDSPERVHDSLKKIKTSSNHLLNLTNDILEMIRIESGKLELSEKPLDMRYFNEKVIHTGQTLAIPKNISFETSMGNMGSPYVLTDELHINEVIVNLISNAMKYTPEGGTVKYSLKQLGTETEGRVTYRFEVSDNGVGMSDEFQEHIFEAFSREANSLQEENEGAGLGLSIVKKIVDILGGSIGVKSKQHKGTTLTVDIPFKVMDKEDIETFRRDSDEYDLSSEFSALAGKKILLVEDNEMNREIAAEILEDSGFVVETAEDGAASLDMITGKGIEYYDYILMDIQMPVMGGYEATETIREMYPDCRIPIIALSANAFEEDRAASFAAGMDAHIAKPINTNELFKVMSKYL